MDERTGNNLVQLNARVPSDLRDRVKVQATVEGLTMTVFVAKVLSRYLHDQAVLLHDIDPIRGVK